MTPPSAGLLLLVVLAPLAGADGASYAPSRVMADANPATTLVSWVPGAELADSFRVYGVDGNSLTLLLDTAATVAPRTFAATVPTGHEAYAVSGVLGGIESAPVLALAECEVVVYVLPSPGVTTEGCLPKKSVLAAKFVHP